MPERDHNLSRRDFNKLIGLGLISIAVSPLERAIYKDFKGYFLDDEISFLDDVSEVRRLPADLYGVNFNAPFLWKRSAREIDDFIYMARSVNADQDMAAVNTVRILPDSPDSPMEEKLGNVNLEQLDKIQGFVDYLPEDFRVVIPIIDGYWIFRSELSNPMYPQSGLDSPYLLDTSSQKAKFYSQMGFFLGDTQRKAYKHRADAMIDRFGQNRKVLMEMGNEIASPIKVGGRHINSVWYAEMYSHIRKGYKGVLLTGVANPDMIDFNDFDDTENLVNTDHIYLPRLKKYPDNVPVIVEEIGVSKNMYGRNIDRADILFKHLMLGCIDNGIDNGVAGVASVFIWHADSGHHDNLEFNSDIYPKTADLITRLSPVLRKKALAME